ncbi:helix-turn-helix domain-containing protein [Spirosoma linguale]|uniref:Transcriptional regulator, AraC family n=1 Tax=Spirosoma linguale (strain ATCC 33905 / DSM 74 / LMG 10896 / Claus 1) TaxID=504472 RepID=D2QTS1_SPILD|nr:transcriptional regulator, AraC family [Spirosoma linguale DSM 74]
MDDVETVDELYHRKFDGMTYPWMPDSIRSGIGHFNVFRLEPLVDGKAKPVPYKRRDYYKVMLVIGNSRVHYADQVVEVKKQALTFSNPHIPYAWEHLDTVRDGFYGIFNHHFFSQFGNLSQYGVFQPNGTHVFELTDEQVSQLIPVYERMFAEIQSDYIHKYDVLRNLVFELLHFAMKMQPASSFDKRTVNASQRIATLFLELLERQFPLDDTHQQVNFRSASDFAAQLNVHVNHLNRAVKETTQKTTTQLIADRILQESKTLLKQSTWSVSDIAYALGFSEVTHFNNFFKKHLKMSPLAFKNG